MHQFYVYVDDERQFDSRCLKDDVVLITCRTYASAIEVLGYCQEYGWEVWLDLDHDLGEAKTGYDICKFIVENQIPILGYTLHSLNIVGKQNMEQLLSHYGYRNFGKTG